MIIKNSTKNIERFFFFILIFLFLLTNSYTVFAADISFGDANGGVAYKQDDGKLYIIKIGFINNNFVKSDYQYSVLSDDIKNILLEKLTHGKFSGTGEGAGTNSKSVIVEEFQANIEGDGTTVNSPILLYGSDNVSDNLYTVDTNALVFKQGLIVLDENFTGADRNVFIAKAGFRVDDNDFPFMVAKITADSDANAANFVWADNVIPENTSAILIENKNILSENNVLKNEFGAKKGNIDLVDAGEKAVVGSSLISEQDKFVESYAKTTEGTINVRKNVITIKNTESGHAFFNAAGGDVNIDTTIVDDSNKGSITISSDGTKKLVGFAKSDKNVNIKTGALDLDVRAIGDANFAESTEDMTINIDQLDLKANDDDELKKSLFKGQDVNVTLGELKITNNTTLSAGAHLLEAAGNAKLTVTNISKDLVNKLKAQFVKSDGTADVTINNLDLTGNVTFTGFELQNNVADNQDATFNIGEILTDGNTKIHGLVTRTNAGKLTVNLSKSIELKGEKTEIKGLVVGDGEASLNFVDNDKVLSLNGTTISGVLVSSDTENANLVDTNGGIDINGVKFGTNSLALVKIAASDKIAKLGNGNSNISIKSLEVNDDANTNTALVLMGTDVTHKAEIKAKNFNLQNSKIGAIVIDNGTINDGQDIEIISTEGLTISNNEFLESFVVGAKQTITIAGGDSKETNISGNTISKAMQTEKAITIGATNSSKTVFSENIAKENQDLGAYFVNTGDTLKVLGKEIEIKDNITNDSAGQNYGLFNANNGIEIGDAKTATIFISGNEIKHKFDASLMKSNISINFNATERIDFYLDKNTFERALEVGNGGVNFKSKNINISGDSTFTVENSNLTNFAESKTLVIGDKNSTSNISISNIALKNNENYFFKNAENINITGIDSSTFTISGLKIRKDNDFSGAVFYNDGNNGEIKVEVGTLKIDSNETSNASIFRQDFNGAEDVIAVNNINSYIVDESTSNKIAGSNMAGLYYGRGKGFKMHGYSDDDTNPINVEFLDNITGIAAIKFGSEEENADNIQYSANAFTMKVGNFVLKPSSVGTNTKAAIVFTNPQYIETDGGGNVTSQESGLKITIKNGGTLDLTMPKNELSVAKPSIAVVAKKQTYDTGNTKKVFEFGETVIEGEVGNSNTIVRMSGYNSLETDDFNTPDNYRVVTADDEVGKSKLTIGENIAEFDTGDSGSKYILHEFEMKSGKMIVHLDNSNKDVNLFKWAGNYKTLSNGANSKDIVVNKGSIILATDSVTFDIEGKHLQGEFTLVPANSNFNFDFSNFKDNLLKNDDDIVIEVREITRAKTDEGFVVKVGQRTGKDLIDSLKTRGKLDELHADVLASSIETSHLVELENRSSGNSNFDAFSINIYEFAKTVFKQKQDKAQIDSVINNVQMPDQNESNSGAVGTIGLSSIKSVTDILGDRVIGGIVPIDSASSRMILLADANDSGIQKKSNNSIDVFTKINFGFGRLKTSDSKRDISNFGMLVGGDFDLLEDKLMLGTSLMYNSTNLEGSYRTSAIKSVVLSLYSKYDILELTNKDKLYVYGIFSYAHSWETEEAKLDIFSNKSNKSANIIAIDALSGYRFNNIGITPELGMGIIYGNQGDYKDDLGQNVSSRNNFVLSLKTNVRYDIPMEYLYDDMTVGLKLGMSYDVLSTGNKGFDVKNPAGLEYRVNDTEGADRFSFNYGINVSYDLDSSSKVSFSYDGVVTKNLFNNKFSFEYRYKIK